MCSAWHVLLECRLQLYYICCSGISCVAQKVFQLPSLQAPHGMCLQVVQHSRRVLSEGGEGVVLQQVSLKVDVKAGQLEGTRYVFEG